MTRQEAIEEIGAFYECGHLPKEEAIKMAINALEQVPTYRKKAKRWKKKYFALKTDIEKANAEIDSYCSDNRDRNDGLYIAMKIIDKHLKVESEEKE